MESIKRWLFSIVVKKMVASAAKSIVALASTYGVSVVASYGGYTLDLKDQAGVAVLINTMLKGLFHSLSHKYPGLAWLSPQEKVSLKDGAPAGDMPKLCDTVLPEDKNPV